MYVVSRSDVSQAQSARSQSNETQTSAPSASMLGYETRCINKLVEGTKSLPSVFAEICTTLASISQHTAE